MSSHQPLHHQQQSGGTPVSVSKILTGLLAIPSNRSCADCKSALVDSTQVHASYSPNFDSPSDFRSKEAANKKINKEAPIHQFRRNHAAFAPPPPPPSSSGSNNNDQTDNPNENKSHPAAHHIPSLLDLPVDPALSAASHDIVGHGVFVCALCGAAHKLLSGNTAITKAVMDSTSWTLSDVQWLALAGGNARATLVLEAHVPTCIKRPTAISSIPERLTFIRAKYEALAFVLPPSGPLAARAWQNIVREHPEWQGLWGVNDLRVLSGLELKAALDRDGGTLNSEMLTRANRKAENDPPNRLVDYFCIVTPSDFLHPSTMQQDLSTALGPEDILLTPQVSDCFPSSADSNNSDGSNYFPEHVSTFVFPDGCYASSTALAPAFFTFVLTNATGERLYGGALTIYDDNKETADTFSTILTNSEYPKALWPPWVTPTATSTVSSSTTTAATSTTSTTSTNNRSSSFSSKIVSNTSSRASTQTRRSQLRSGDATAPDVIFMPKCLVVISHYPFFDLWRKFLLQIYRIALTEAPLPIERFVANFVCEVPLPPPGKIQVKFGFTVEDKWIIERPPGNQLPLSNFSYLPLFTCLSVSNVLVLMGCLLQETRVALVSKHYALIGPVSEALLSLLFPFHWQGMYLPILPYSMLEILDAPVPYLVGLHSRYLREVPVESRPQGVVFVDLDCDEVHLGYCDDSDQNRKIPSLPERHALKLKTRLTQCAGCVYVVPPSQRVGFVSNGTGAEIPQFERDPYAQLSNHETSQYSYARRRDILPQTDKAFGDNELLVPLSGFLSEHGRLLQRETTHDTREKKGIFPFVRAIKRSGSFDSVSDSLENAQAGLLDLDDPHGFITIEIRDACLRFFTSLFQTYRMFLNGTDFRSSDFVVSLNLSLSSAAYVSAVLQTQMFQGFVEEHGGNPEGDEVLFFDASINAKINRSKKIALTGRRKETSFLNDTRAMVTEIFTPPPPSNFGLPDDGRFYHYGTFPELDHSLFGKIRQPMDWQDHSRAPQRIFSRRASIATIANEQAVVEKAASTVRRVTKRGVRNLETALKALSTPFVPIPSRANGSMPPQSNREGRSLSRESLRSNCSDVTMPSTLDFTPDVISSAEEIVLNARRKQAILLSIIVKLQRNCRIYLIKKGRLRRLRKSCVVVQNDPLSAAIHIQMQLRRYLAQRRFQQIRAASISIVACRRGAIIRVAFLSLLARLTHVQASYRGHLLRQQLSNVFTLRMMKYKKCLFPLWYRACTPLTYRCQFWSLMNTARCIRLAVSEQELSRLWTELRIKVPLPGIGDIPYDEESRIAAHLGITSTTCWQAQKIEYLLAAERTPIKSRRNSKAVDMLADRVLAERTQIYERLSITSIGSLERLNTYFLRFAIPLKEKKKKAALTESLWTTYADADHSAEVMFDIFPELHNSSEIIFLSPSKKAIRRFPTCDPAPKPLRSTFWAQKILDDRIRVYVAEIADLSLRVVPSLMERLNTDGKNSARSTTRETSALLLVPSFEIRRRLFQKQGYQTSKVAERTHHTKVNGICSFGIKPGRTAVSNALEAPSYPDLLAPVMQKIPLQT